MDAYLGSLPDWSHKEFMSAQPTFRAHGFRGEDPHPLSAMSNKLHFHIFPLLHNTSISDTRYIACVAVDWVLIVYANDMGRCHAMGDQWDL